MSYTESERDAKIIAQHTYNAMCLVVSDLDALATQLAREGRLAEIQLVRELFRSGHESMQRIKCLAFPDKFPRKMQPGELMPVMLTVDLDIKSAAGGE